LVGTVEKAGNDTIGLVKTVPYHKDLIFTVAEIYLVHQGSWGQFLQTKGPPTAFKSTEECQCMLPITNSAILTDTGRLAVAEVQQSLAVNIVGSCDGRTNVVSGVPRDSERWREKTRLSSEQCTTIVARVDVTGCRHQNTIYSDQLYM